MTKNPSLKLIFALIFILILAGSGYAIWRVFSNLDVESSLKEEPEISEMHEPPIINQEQEFVTEKEDTGTANPDWQVYRNEEYGFEIQYPAYFDIYRDEIELLKWPHDMFFIANEEKNCQIFSGFHTYALPNKIPFSWSRRENNLKFEDTDFLITYLYDNEGKQVILVAETLPLDQRSNRKSFSVLNFNRNIKKNYELNDMCIAIFKDIISTFQFIEK